MLGLYGFAFSHPNCYIKFKSHYNRIMQKWEIALGFQEGFTTKKCLTVPRLFYLCKIISFPNDVRSPGASISSVIPRPLKKSSGNTKTGHKSHYTPVSRSILFWISCDLAFITCLWNVRTFFKELASELVSELFFSLLTADNLREPRNLWGTIEPNLKVFWKAIEIKLFISSF